MYAWESIQKAIEYIEGHVQEEISIDTLADIACLSPFYFQRLFKRLVKKSVFEYVRLRRLAQAAQALKGNKRIIDVAVEYGFSSHANFTRAFKEAYNITPEEYRENPVHLSQVMKPELLLNYIMVDEGVPLITDDIVIEITRKRLDMPETYIGISGKVSVEQASFGEVTGVSGPGQVWDDFHKQKESVSCFLADGIELGASMMSGEDDGTFIYFAGAAADSCALVPDGFTAWELSAGEYIVCQFEAENYAELRTSAIDKVLKYLFETWLPGHNLQTQPFSAEKYTGTTADPASMEIWVLPIQIAAQEGR